MLCENSHYDEYPIGKYCENKKSLDEKCPKSRLMGGVNLRS